MLKSIADTNRVDILNLIHIKTHLGARVLYKLLSTYAPDLGGYID